LSANGHLESRSVTVGSCTADLLGFKSARPGFDAFFVTSWGGAHIVCFLTYQTRAIRTLPGHSPNLRWTWHKESHYTNEPLNWVGQITFPVICSMTYDKATVEFAKAFKPSSFSRQEGRILHPVRIELVTKSVYHLDGLMIGAVGFRGVINKSVNDALP
jgi:hypothetical protein